MRTFCRSLLLTLALVGSLSMGSVCRAADPAAKGEESLDVRYARASLALAQMRLEAVVNSNKQVAGILPEAVIEPLRQVVAICEEQLEQSRSGAAPNARNIEVRAAKASLATAQADAQRAEAINRTAPGTISDHDLRELRQAIEVGRLRLEKAQTLPAQFTAAELEWQFRELNKQILELRSRVEQLSVRE
jgi:hypothetical protein